jgi:hypothetical protein
MQHCILGMIWVLIKTRYLASSRQEMDHMLR